MRWHVAGLEMDGGGAVVVARDEPVQDLGQEAPLLGAQPAHDAEVDGNDAAFLVDQQVALVHVGVKEAIAHGVAQERLQRGEAQFPQIVAGGFQGCVIGNRDAVDPFERENAERGAAPIDCRDAEASKLGRADPWRCCRPSPRSQQPPAACPFRFRPNAPGSPPRPRAAGAASADGSARSGAQRRNSCRDRA